MRRTNPVKVLKAQPRLLIAALAGVLVWLILPRHWQRSTRLLVAWDLATGLYLAMALVMMSRSNTTKIRFRAAREDAGQFAVLVLTSVTAMISLGGILRRNGRREIQRASRVASSRACWAYRGPFMDVYPYDFCDPLRTSVFRWTRRKSCGRARVSR